MWYRRPGPRWLPLVLVGVIGLLIGCLVGGTVGLVVGHFTGHRGHGGYSRYDDRRPAFPQRPGFGPHRGVPPRVPGPAVPANPSPAPSHS